MKLWDSFQTLFNAISLVLKKKDMLRAEELLTEIPNIYEIQWKNDSRDNFKKLIL